MMHVTEPNWRLAMLAGAASCNRGRHRKGLRIHLVVGLVAILFVWQCACFGGQPGPAAFSDFQEIVRSGDQQQALATGRQLYTRLALEADGGDVFYTIGIRLACFEQATQGLVSTLKAIHAGQKPPAAANGAVESCARSMRYVLNPARRIVLPDGELGRFLETYTGLCLNACFERILAVMSEAATVEEPVAAATTDCLTFLLTMADTDALEIQPNLKKAAVWIVSAGQGERAIDQALTRNSSAAAGAVCKAMLSSKPGDADARKALIDLVSRLCTMQQVEEALSLCAWAKEVTQDSTYSTVLVLQQAVIIGRDQKNHALAVRLCDQITSAADEPRVVHMARYLAGMFSLEMANYPDVLRRAGELAEDPATPLPYKLKATALSANALQKQGKSAQAVQLLLGALGELSEPEPADAATCREALCQLLMLQGHYQDAAGQARVLVARHPGHPSAETAAKMLQQLEKATGPAAVGSK